MNGTIATPTVDLFRTNDSCDRCSAQARVLVLFNTGGELVFCRHHARRFRSALEPIALVIERDPEQV
ncbi:DUF7455 domain-containing protein [Actinophytocola gossypii]|uniref:DUF7455 domain-containing protein n=1 Tax=Actinophytocola gossypii TaxID=2812003 RepID=A0ABT2JJL4_9PSEU|nr:hypothetical protein [Actinophytocola gossypii]MCT2587928.1 hypothetical protein [Actinophytocola gossypii]